MLTFMDTSSDNSPKDRGYVFVYADGTQSGEMACTTRGSGTSCQDETSQPGVRAIYEQLRVAPVAAIKRPHKRHDLVPETARAMLATFSCISP